MVAPRRGTKSSGTVDFISVWFDLPLNGEWSDLTATVDVLRTPAGLRLVLDDVRLM